MPCTLHRRQPRPEIAPAMPDGAVAVLLPTLTTAETRRLCEALGCRVEVADGQALLVRSEPESVWRRVRRWLTTPMEI